MNTYKHSLWSMPTLLIVAVMVAVGAGVPTTAANAADKSKVENAVKVQKKEENRLKKLDKSYSKQAKAMANQFIETAKLVELNGHDPQQLLDAAAYFESESNELER